LLGFYQPVSVLREVVCLAPMSFFQPVSGTALADVAMPATKTAAASVDATIRAKIRAFRMVVLLRCTRDSGDAHQSRWCAWLLAGHSRFIELHCRNVQNTRSAARNYVLSGHVRNRITNRQDPLP